MVIDTSAVIAIVLNEREHEKFAEAIAGASTRLISAANLFEAALVMLNRSGAAGEALVDDFVRDADVKIVDVTARQIGLARAAFRDYGKGRHAASLNFGDCFAYALSKATGEPLLFKGDDFARTDVAAAC